MLPLQPMSQTELWQLVHDSYGDELGLTSSDDDYLQPIEEDEDDEQRTSDGRITPITNGLDKVRTVINL